jgi:hypothetical protein
MAMEIPCDDPSLWKLLGKYCAFSQLRKTDAPKTLMLQVVQDGWCLASRDLSLELWFIIVIDSKLLVLMEVDDHSRLQSNYDGDSDCQSQH